MRIRNGHLKKKPTKITFFYGFLIMLHLLVSITKYGFCLPSKNKPVLLP